MLQLDKIISIIKLLTINVVQNYVLQITFGY
jgi:hypothetical protein